MNTQQPDGTPEAPRPDYAWQTMTPPQPMKASAVSPRPNFHPNPSSHPHSPYGPGGPGGPYGPGAQGTPGDPGAPGGGARPPFVPTSPPPRREPRFSREQVVAALLAAAGIGVTLIGVVLLLAMAAREGMLTPPVRVGGGSVLVAALAGSALWVRPRPGGRIGSLALLTTAVAGAFFIVVAVARIYEWIPLTAGLALALIVAGATSRQALRWDERWLFVAVTLGVAILAPALTDGINATLVGFLAVLQLTGVVPELAKGWDEVALSRTLPVAFAASAWVSFEPTETRAVVFAAATVAAIGLLSAVQAGLTRRDAIGAPISLGMSWMPLWVFAAVSERTSQVLVTGVMTIAGLVGFALVRRVHSTVRVAMLAVTAISAVMFLIATAHGDWRAAPFFATAIVLMGLHLRYREQLVGLVAMGVFALALVVQGSTTPYIDFFYRGRVSGMPTEAAIAGLLACVFAGLAVVAVRGKGMPAGYVQAVLVVAGAAAIVGCSMVALLTVGGTRTGFFLVHLAITVLSMALAALVLVAGLSRPRHLLVSMNWGLALVACALLKLMAFDLHYMGSMTKALTFVAAGLVLLVAGTKYARVYAEASAARGRRNDPGTQAADQSMSTAF